MREFNITSISPLLVSSATAIPGSFPGPYFIATIKISSPVPPVVAAPTSVVARRLFYNNSKFDGNSAAANAVDDSSIATGKTPLLPNGVATFANYDSYARGLNGLMIDLDQLLVPLALNQFTFRFGNQNNLNAWTPAPAPLALDVRSLGGTISRATLVWPDGAIKNQWLEVRLNNPGMIAPDVFYFGNAVGESGNDAQNAFVNATDEIAARNHPATFLLPAAIDNLYDFNRDGFVNATDQILARSNATSVGTALKLITVPAAFSLPAEDSFLQGAIAAASDLHSVSPSTPLPLMMGEQSNLSTQPVQTRVDPAVLSVLAGALLPVESSRRPTDDLTDSVWIKDVEDDLLELICLR